MNDQLDTAFDEAVAAITKARALLIGAGAGMSVDSGLPDYRGSEGFWNAYPPLKGRSYSELSNPKWFARDPEFAWGFFGHCYNLYSQAKPHPGFRSLQVICEQLGTSTAIYTSNVDGHFQKSGFAPSQVVECHGSIHHLQCAVQCTPAVWRADALKLEIDDEIRLTSPLPRCKLCDNLARPNIVLFGEYAWNSGRTEKQEKRFRRWLKEHETDQMVVIEIGAGTAVPMVRYVCEATGAALIRINPQDSSGAENVIPIPMNAQAALLELETRLQTAA